MSIAGRLKHRGLLETVTEAQDAGTREPIRTWAITDTIWMRVHPVSGDESLKALQVAENISHVVEVRYQDNVVSKQRLLVPESFTQLTEALDDSEVGVDVDKAFPHSINFLILCESELMKVTGGSNTTTWTVVRGVDGTTPATHADDKQVKIMRILQIESVRDHELRRILLSLDCVSTDLEED